MKDLAAIIAKHEAPATAEPAPDASSAPPAGVSEAGSAAADAASSLDTSVTSPAATNTHDELQEKLDRDRAARALKDERRRARLEREAAEKTKRDADAELAKWKTLGKDKKWLDAIKEAGHDPRKVFDEMRDEALKSGTPDARIDALEKALAEERAERAKEREETEKERKQREDDERSRADDQMFTSDFQRGLGDAKYASLLHEYEPGQLFTIATNLRKNPSALFAHGRSLKLPLQYSKGTFTMKDIFDVMHATQAAHQSRMQRRNESAASQSSQAESQTAEVKPTVNGTVERKAGSTNPTPSGRDAEEEKLKKMSRSERREYLAKKYP